VCIIRATLVAAVWVAAAAPADAVSFRLGAQALGANSSLIGDLPDEGDWEGKFDVGAGIIAELTLTPVLAISFQPAYVPRGATQVFKQRNTVIASIDYDLNYVSLPVIVRVTGDPVGVRGFVTAGLDFGILIDATAQSDTGSTDISDGLDSTTFGALFGAGVMVPVKRNFFTFEVRYSQGLDDIVSRNSSTDTGMASQSVKYRGFGLLVGFLFTLGGQ